MVALVTLKPEHPEEAREKLVYLMALMTSNAAVLAVSEVERAIHTLRPFKTDLAEALGKRTAGARNETDEGSPPVPEVAHQSTASRT